LWIPKVGWPTCWPASPITLQFSAVSSPVRYPPRPLHLAIQAAMGWTNSHLYEIRARDVGWSTPDPGIDWSRDFLGARKARLDEVLEDVRTKKLRYV
jgi:hypothetical protein